MKEGSVKKSRTRSTTRRASRPHMPGYEMMFGNALLSWRWALKRLSESHNYWIATVRPDGRPHMAGVWGIWMNNMFYFTSREKARKARNLRANQKCVVCPERADQAVIVEGVARKISWSRVPRQFRSTYKKKYNWNVDPSMGPVYAVQPSVIFGIVENAGDSSPGATRWRF